MFLTQSYKSYDYQMSKGKAQFKRTANPAHKKGVSVLCFYH